MAVDNAMLTLVPGCLSPACLLCACCSVCFGPDIPDCQQLQLEQLLHHQGSLLAVFSCNPAAAAASASLTHPSPQQQQQHLSVYSLSLGELRWHKLATHGAAPVSRTQSCIALLDDLLLVSGGARPGTAGAEQVRLNEVLVGFACRNLDPHQRPALETQKWDCLAQAMPKTAILQVDGKLAMAGHAVPSVATLRWCNGVNQEAEQISGCTGYSSVWPCSGICCHAQPPCPFHIAPAGAAA